MSIPDEALSSDLDTVRGWIDAAQRVVVLTGAGISPESGIPDFRSGNGIWARYPPEEYATIEAFWADFFS